MVAIYDVMNDHPAQTDVFFVDTCCWTLGIYVLGLSAGLATYQDQYRGSAYGTYLQKVRKIGGQIVLFSYQLAELASSIEDIRYTFYLNRHGQTRQGFSVKEYREIAAERTLVTKEIEATWNMVKRAAVQKPVHLPNLNDQNMLTTLKTTLLDGYDAIAGEGMASQGITRVITDDGDYLTAGTLDVFTAAPKFLRSGQVIHAR